MALTPRLDLKQSQSLLMTQQLRQAINLLQVSNLELESIINQELEKNPLLERENDRLADSESSEQTINDYDTPQENPYREEEDFKPDIDCDNEFDDYGSDREGYETGNQYDWQDYAQNKNHRSDSEDYDYFEQKLSAEKSLYELLDEQISTHFSTPKEQIIARRLCEFLDAAGYFRGNVEQIAATLHTTEVQIEQILAQLKNFEPAGIFAQDLAECLKIQLADLGRLDPMAESVLEHLDLLAAKKFLEIKKICALNDEDLESIISDIKSLNPKPTAHYEQTVNANIIPDVFVRRQKSGEYVVELNQMSLPRVLINQEYYHQVSGKSGADKYLRQQLSHASFLVKALHQRAETILKVSEEIVKTQRDFFEYGIEYLKPMQLRDIAEKAEVHESTVSRAVANKYMHTPKGIFELKYFFSNAAGKLDGSDNTSTLSIKHRIKELISQEQPQAILSDDNLVERLASEGIKIARRTVAKYREAMNIPTSAERKRQKRPGK